MEVTDARQVRQITRQLKLAPTEMRPYPDGDCYPGERIDVSFHGPEGVLELSSDDRQGEGWWVIRELALPEEFEFRMLKVWQQLLEVAKRGRGAGEAEPPTTVPATSRLR